MANCLAESLTTARMTLGWIAGASACSSCSEGYFAGEAGGHLSMLIDGGRTRIFRVYRPAAFAALPCRIFIPMLLPAWPPAGFDAVY